MSTNKAAESILSNAMKGLSFGELAGAGLNVGFGISRFSGTYNESVQQGHGKAISTVKGVSNAAMSGLIPGKVHVAVGVLKNAPKLAVTGYETMSQQARSMSLGINQPFATSHFQDNQQIYTMRQAGMSLAEKSKYNLQQTLMGNEAQYFHR